MKFAYKFSNLLGTVYRKGNVVFTPDGNSVISPVGNKISIFNLKSNKAHTLTLESRVNYTAIDISPDGCLMIAGNENGQVQMISLVSHKVINTYKLSTSALCIKFSPNGAYFAVAKENMVFIFKTPGQITGEYNQFVLRRYFFASQDDISWIDWSSDSNVLLIGSRDNSVKVYAVDLYKNFRPYILGGHTDAIVGCFFEENSLDVNTISKNGQVFIWECSLKLTELEPMSNDDVIQEIAPKKSKESSDGEDNVNEDTFAETSESTNKNGIEKSDEDPNEIDVKPKSHPFSYTRLARHYLIKAEDKNVHLTSAIYHKKTKLLITAFSSGTFYLHELPEVSLIHSLSISQNAIESVCFNSTGDWIALASTGLGQLLVWEWQNEQYVMKQQGHSGCMCCISFSPNGQYIATGGDDGKVKLWNVNNGFCLVTFHEHSSGVTSIEFSVNKSYLISSSLDGTVRAFDILRFRNFRTFTTPRPVQFANVAIDFSDELVAAGAQDVFEIYLWSMKHGRLLEVLSGHEGPVSSLSFAQIATSTLLVSGSWDKTIKIWDCLESSSANESIDIGSDVVDVAFNPNGEEVAVACINGTIQIFNVKTSNQIASIEGKNDLGQSISETELTSAKKNSQSRCFTSITYSADGLALLAAGKSKFVCIYHIRDGILLKKFEITQNHSLDGLDEYLSHRKITEFGNLALIEQRETFEGGNVAIKLPGVKKTDMASRNHKPEVNVYSVRFSPTGQSWAAATTEGLLLFALDRGIVFDPFNLTMDITTKSTREFLNKNDFGTALLMALKLNEFPLIQEVVEQIPREDIHLIVSSLPSEYAHRMLKVVSKLLSISAHVEFYLCWTYSILSIHGPVDGTLSHPSLLKLEESLLQKYKTLNNMCDFNKYTLNILTKAAETKAKAKANSESMDES